MSSIKKQNFSMNQGLMTQFRVSLFRLLVRVVSPFWVGIFWMVPFLSLSAIQPIANSSETLINPPKPEMITPAPLYRDPVFDGAADPVLIWNPQRQTWWMYYTQRRAKLDLRGVAWAHGTEIGVAESSDAGMTWNYIGQLPLWHPDPGYSFWAPDLIQDESGIYHLFVTYVPGEGDKHVTWDGTRFIFQYTSKDLWNWEFVQKIPTSSEHCIDPSLCRRPDGSWRMWYKDEARNSDTLALESLDLMKWQSVPDPGVSQR